jgi:hypothetical protein
MAPFRNTRSGSALYDLVAIEHEWSVTDVETAGIPFWGELIG